MVGHLLIICYFTRVVVLVVFNRWCLRKCLRFTLVKNVFFFFFLNKKGRRERPTLFYLGVTIVAPAHWELHMRGLDDGNRRHSLKSN
jgi:hypothetical protein